MWRRFQFIIGLLVFLQVISQGFAFSLIGPREPWQTLTIGYTRDRQTVDPDGPMNLGEEYRWNEPVLTYGVDAAFLNYYGRRGEKEIDAAVSIINALPQVSKLSRELTEFPLNTVRENPEAAALNLQDLKSNTIDILLHELGLTSAERYIWTMHARVVRQASTNYIVIQRNFDPITLQPTAYLNGALYSYQVIGEGSNPLVVDASEILVDPFSVGSSVASKRDFSLFEGQFITGLTRDDVGGLRYLYTKQNKNVELLQDGVTGGGGPYDPANSSNTNFINQALRPGVEKVTLKKLKFDSRYGGFVPITNVFTDTYITNRSTRKQTLQRVINVPDIVFTARDLQQGDGIFYAVFTDPSGWQNNGAINSSAANAPGTLAGPGVITPPITVTFNKSGQTYDNSPFFLSEEDATIGFRWGTFDGSTNAPIIYPLPDIEF